MNQESSIKTIEWNEGQVRIIDQTKLPYSFEFVDLKTSEEVANAIKTMIVRGAPAIGIAGAFGIALAAMELKHINNKKDFLAELEKKAKFINSTRPTAVNLSWAVNAQLTLARELDSDDVALTIEKIKDNALLMYKQDIETNKSIGMYGSEIVPKSAKILTHCNAGALATAGYGTALGVIRAAFEKDSGITVFVDETRPRLQGAKLTAWELIKDNIPVTLITDGMCGYCMSNGMIDMVVVGADRIAANGDTANKIGTYTVAVVAKENNIPFYIAAPTSTIDISIKTGNDTPIEERNKEEVTHINNNEVAPKDVNILNPSFDITPCKYITGIITEFGILNPNFEDSILNLFKEKQLV